MLRLKGKTCVVTAAGQGIGKSSAERLAAEGARVVASDINAAALARLSGVQTLALDVTDPAAIDSFAATVGPVDVLFNCAGVVHSGTVLDCTLAQWQQAWTLNVSSMFHMVRAFLPAMLQRKSGVIINMSSVASSVKGVPGRCAYSASKAAVIGLTKSIAADFVASGIRCHAICPGTVDSPSLHERLSASGDYQQARQDFIARQPMGRFAAPDEIAALVAYLASDEAAFITGQCHVIDGGWTN